MNGFPFVPLFGWDAERTGSGAIEYAGEPGRDLTVNMEFHGIRLLSCVVETVRDYGLGSMWSVLGHGRVQGGEVAGFQGRV